MELFELSAVAVATIPIVIGLVGIATTLGLNKKYAPVLALVFGFLLVALSGVVWQFAIAQGIIVGLASSGLYSGVKKMVK